MYLLTFLQYVDRCLLTIYLHPAPIDCKRLLRHFNTLLLTIEQSSLTFFVTQAYSLICRGVYLQLVLHPRTNRMIIR